MRIKYFLKLKEETHQEPWIILTRYNLISIGYRIHKHFRYMISNKTITTEQPVINFYYEDIIPYIKKQNSILDLQNNSRTIYNQILQNEYSKYLIIGQSI